MKHLINHFFFFFLKCLAPCVSVQLCHGTLSLHSSDLLHAGFRFGTPVHKFIPGSQTSQSSSCLFFFFCAVYMLQNESLVFNVNNLVKSFMYIAYTGLFFYVLLASSCGRVQGNGTICFSQCSQEQGAYPSFALLLLHSSCFLHAVLKY